MSKEEALRPGLPARDLAFHPHVKERTRTIWNQRDQLQIPILLPISCVTLGNFTWCFLDLSVLAYEMAIIMVYF